MPDRALTPDRLQRLQDHFEQALDLTGAARDEYLASIEQSDPEMAQRIRGLLDAHMQTDSALRSPVPSPPLSHDNARWVGRRVGVYDVQRLIGVGGMGTVYEATRADDQYRKRVAIKLLGAQATSDTAQRRFRRERQILANLSHPNIAALLDGGVTEDGQPYFVMEYIEGEPLTTYCDSRSLSIRERLSLFLQVCDAVQYAHQSLVVHRDLKPGNILVANDGDTAMVKLLDFGIAKLLPTEGDDSSEQPLTRAGTRAFTPDYASPEQLLGFPIGTRSDVYSLGVVLYELLCGARPFDLRGRSAIDVERVVSQETPTRPSAALRDERAQLLAARTPAKARVVIAGDLDAIVLQALRKEPERRYPTVDELAADVRNHLEGRPVRARPDTFGYRFGKLVRRRRIETASIVIIAATIAVAVIGSVYQARVANRERLRAENERQRATEVTTFLTTMLGAANPGAFGKDVRVREVLDSAAIKADALTLQPAMEAEIRSVIGNTYLALGELDLAELQYRKSLAASQREWANGSAETAAARSRLSMAIEYQGRYAEADSVLAIASATYGRVGYPNLETHIEHLDARGRILGYLGRTAEARDVLREALALQKQRVPWNDSSISTSYTNLAVAESDLGDNASAETLMVAAVTAAKRAYGPEHPLVAAIMSPLASVQARAGYEDRADSTYRATIEMRRKLLGEEHPEVAWTMFNYADQLLTVGRYTESVEWARKVLAMRGKSLDDSHVAISTSMSLLGRALDRLDSLEEGGRWLRESLRLRKANFPAGHVLIISVESQLGEHLTLLKRYPEAEDVLLRTEKALIAARGESAPIVADARKRIVALYDAWGKSVEAARWKALCKC